MRYRTIAASVLLWTLFPSIAVVSAETEDPWRGKQADEVTAVLGPPDKVKQSAGVRTLFYKLMLPGEQPPLDPAIDEQLTDFVARRKIELG